MKGGALPHRHSFISGFMLGLFRDKSLASAFNLLIKNEKKKKTIYYSIQFW